MNKICKYKQLVKASIFGLSLVCFSGCGLTQKPVNTIAVGTISCQNIANGIVELIKHVRTADQGTISLKNISNETTVQSIEQNVSQKLKADGYAVQIILPASQRQKGDLKEQPVSGTLTTINVQHLEGSNQYQLSVILGTQAYYRLLSKQGSQLVAVSNWARQQNY